MNDALMNDMLLSKQEIRDIYKISITTLDRWTALGKIPKIKFGESRRAMVRFRKSDIERLINKNTV